LLEVLGSLQLNAAEGCRRVLAYLEFCLNRRLYPLCLLPGTFPRLGLVLGLRETAYGLAAPVFCLNTGDVEEHDPCLLDPVNPEL
jgi:hypothetical protein